MKILKCTKLSNKKSNNIFFKYLIKHFSNQDKSNIKEDLKDFNLKFDKTNTNYEIYQSQMSKNISNLLDPEIQNISSAKLAEKLREQGIEKTQEEVDLIAKLAEKGNSEETLRYMAVDEFSEKYRKRVGDQKMKFLMPIGWGWAFPIVKYSAGVILAAKAFTGISWLPFFMVCGVTIRLLFLPLVIRQMILIQRMAKVSPNIRLLGYCTMKCDLPLSKKAYYFMRSLWKYSTDAKVNPISFAAYNILQIPVFFLLVMSIRKICYEEDLKNTGILWFKNLGEADPYMILPLISVGITYYNLGRGINKDNEHWFINKWRSFFQICQICYLPFTCNWPVGSHIYWITSTVLVNIQQSVLRHPKVMAKINPTFYEDMQKVFQTERNKDDSQRYIEKLKKCEDPILKSPTSNSKVLYELSYEKTRMKLYLKNLKYKKKVKSKTNSIITRISDFFMKKKEKNKNEGI